MLRWFYLIVACSAWAQSQFDPSQFVTLNYSQESTIIAPLTSMDIDYWHPRCPDPENQWLHYAVKTWTAKMQLYLDFSPGFGKTFVPMAKATNWLAITFICSNDPSLNTLLHNLATNRLAEKVSISLLEPFRPEWTADYYKESLVSRLTHYGVACPDLAHAQYMQTAQLSDLSLLLHNKELLVDSCAATIYFDTNVTSLLEAVSDYLHAADYALEYVELCSECAPDGGRKNVRRFLFAAPKTARDPAAEPPLPQLRLSADAERLSFERFFAKSMKYNQAPECDAAEAPSDAFALSVPWSVLTPPTSPVSMCFPEVLHGHLREEQEELRVERAQDLREDGEVTMYLRWRCAAWTRRLRKRYELQIRHRLVSDPSALISCFAYSTPTATAKVAWSTVPRDELHERLMGVVDAELAAASAECGGFAQQQYFFLLQLHAMRRAHSNASTPLYAKEALPVAYAHHPTADAETVQRRWFAVDDAAGRSTAERDASEDVDEDGASFSSGLGAQRRRQISARPPLGVLWEPERCSDPMFCQLLYGFQRRLFLWQNPDQRHLLSKLFRVDEFNGVEINDVQRLWEGRTCANAKFLIYEPWTDFQGLGSMWEQIAAAMRYAVCHGRILVLYSAEDLAGTARKWRYPGCRGSLWECYFEPLSSCTLTAQAYAQAIRLPDDVPLDSEDYAQEQFVRFEGIQIVGKCQYSDGDWPDDEASYDADGADSFFEGVGVKRFSLPAKQTVVEVFNPNYAAFASSFRHLTTMPFVRYLMRPRAWLQRLLPQLVAATMVSPVAGPQTQAAFPEHFVSLHVRHGMKQSEEDLQPLARYMAVLARKYPTIRDVFLSTETEALLFQATREYPQYRFHHLHYTRSEFLFLCYSLPKRGSPSWARPPICLEDDLVGDGFARYQAFCPPNADEDLEAIAQLPRREKVICMSHAGMRYYSNVQVYHSFLYELLMSLANLYVSVEADGWVGTLSSNWATVTTKLARSRGDGGGEFHSVDRGTFYTIHF